MQQVESYTRYRTGPMGVEKWVEQHFSLPFVTKVRSQVRYKVLC